MKIFLNTSIVFAILIVIVGCSVNRTEKKNHHNKHHEKYYQTRLCNRMQGEMEYRLSDNTRVDCLTNTYAIEVDFAKKWAESIGQSLYYAQMTGKQPAIGLIVSKNDTRYIKRLYLIAYKYNIKVILLDKE